MNVTLLCLLSNPFLWISVDLQLICSLVRKNVAPEVDGKCQMTIIISSCSLAAPLAYMGDAVSYHPSQQPTSLDLTFPAGDFICGFLMGLVIFNCVVHFLWNFICGNYVRPEMKVNSSNKDLHLLLPDTTSLGSFCTKFLI